MSSEWQEYRLGDITNWASGGTPSKQNPEYWGGSIPWISASSMKAKVCAHSDERITEEAVRSGARMCDSGTILLLVRGSELHKRIPIGVAKKRVAFNQDVKAITTCSDTLSSDYLYYLLKGSEEFLLNSVEFTGIGAGKLETPFLQNLVFPIPTREEQALITDFMIALDDKIELNRKTNETLEAMAKALFKSWFVDFDPVRAKAEGRSTGLPAEISDLFPDSFEDSELGEIPSGWEIKALDEVAHFLNGLALQKFPPEDGAATLPVIKIAQLKKGDSTGADRCSTAVPSDYVVRDGDVLFSWSGSLAVDIWCGGDGALNQHLFKVTSKTYGKWFFYQWVNHHLPVFQEIAQGKATTMGHIQRHHLSEAKALIPTPSLLVAMDSAFAPLLDRAYGLRKQSKDLATTRDALLPKLISGEIRIPDAEKMLEEVGI